MQGAAPGIGVANRLWLFTDKLPFKVLVLGTDLSPVSCMRSVRWWVVSGYESVIECAPICWRHGFKP